LVSLKFQNLKESSDGLKIHSISKGDVWKNVIELT